MSLITAPAPAPTGRPVSRLESLMRARELGIAVAIIVVFGLTTLNNHAFAQVASIQQPPASLGRRASMSPTGSSTNLLTRARNLERIRQISEVAVRHGFGYFFERHNLWHALRLRRRQASPPPAQRGRHLRQMLEELGPTFIKF